MISWAAILSSTKRARLVRVAAVDDRAAAVVDGLAAAMAAVVVAGGPVAEAADGRVAAVAVAEAAAGEIAAIEVVTVAAEAGGAGRYNNQPCFEFRERGASRGGLPFFVGRMPFFRCMMHEM
jgi:hypothetical protein